MRHDANHYDFRELAGAFGDLGTLVPFVTGYITVSGMDATGTLVARGCCQMAAGLHFRTPVAVPPMKAIGPAPSRAGGIAIGLVRDPAVRAGHSEGPELIGSRKGAGA